MSNNISSNNGSGNGYRNGGGNGYARSRGGRPPKRPSKTTTPGLRLGDDLANGDDRRSDPTPDPERNGIRHPLLDTVITWNELRRIAVPDSQYERDLTDSNTYYRRGGTIAIVAAMRLRRIRRVLGWWREAFASGNADDIYSVRWTAFDVYERAVKYGDRMWAAWCRQIASGVMPEGDFPGLAEGLAAYDGKNTYEREMREKSDREWSVNLTRRMMPFE
jgi:hypothetical protein